MTIDFKALVAKVKETGEDMTKAQAFTEAEPYPEGTHRARFVGYIEIGKQKAKYQGKDKIENQVVLMFELSGPRIKPREDGQPNLFTLRPMNKSLSEKAGFFKVFQRLNYAGKATHIAELLGEAYLVKLHHRKYKRNDGTEGTAVEMRKKGEPYDIMAPRVEDVDTGEWKPIAVEPAKAPLRCFLWDYADKAQWDSIFIDGVWEERKNDKGEVTKPARSKNVYQNSVKLATNFQGSPIHALLAASGGNIDIPDAESGLDHDGPADDDGDATPSGATTKGTPVGAAADDALAGVV